MTASAFKPGTMGKITTVLEMKNIGIDGKTYMIAEARIARVRTDNPQIGDTVEYKRAGQGVDKGNIIFLAIKERASPEKKPIDEGLDHSFDPPAAKKEPMIIAGVYEGKSGTMVSIKESDGMVHPYPADITLLDYLSKPDTAVHAGDTVSVRLVDAGGKWVAKDIGPAQKPEGFRNGKDILQENLERKQAETAANPPPVKGPIETISETDAKDLIARGEAAKMEKIQKEAAEHTEKMKAENAARKASEPSLSDPVKVPASFVKSENPPILNPVREEFIDPGEPSEGEHIAPIEVGVHIDMGGYTNFDLKLADISGDRARQRIEGDSMKMIGVMRRLMTAAKKGY